MSDPDPPQPMRGNRRDSKLRQTLGLGGLTFYGLGLMIGAGIYSILGAAAGVAGNDLWMAFLIGSFAAVFTGLSYAEMATMYPKAGAEYVYLSRGLPEHRWVPAIAGIVLVTGTTASAATVSMAFAGYLNVFVSLSETALAAALLLVVTALSIWGVRASSWANVVLTLATVGGLLLFAYVGVRQPDFGEVLSVAPTGGALQGAALVFFAYLGFEDIANFAEEATDPGRDVPRAMLLALGTTTVLYLLVSLAALALASPDLLGESTRPLSLAVRDQAPWAAPVIAAIALFATATTALISLVTASRMLFGMAEGGDLPAPLAETWSGHGTPWIAALVALSASLALLPFGGLEAVASVSSFAALVGFTAVNATLILLRYRAPEVERPFRVPVTIGRFSVPAAMGVVLSLALGYQFGLRVYTAGAVAMGLGLALYLSRNAWGQHADQG